MVQQNIAVDKNKIEKLNLCLDYKNLKGQWKHW